MTARGSKLGVKKQHSLPFGSVLISVLHQGPVDSPEKAVKAAIVQEHKQVMIEGHSQHLELSEPKRLELHLWSRPVLEGVNRDG